MRRSAKFTALAAAVAGLVVAVVMVTWPQANGGDILVLVTLDTLRADHLSVYGYPRETAPFLTELASESLVFESTMSSAPLTAPSHSTMLTGLYPYEHGVNVNGPALDDEIPTVVNELSEQGYETAAFLSVGFLGRVAGSFSYVDANPRNAANTVAAASAWIERLPHDAKAFVWVHLYDIHNWYHGTENISKSLLSAIRATGDPDEFSGQVADLHGWNSSPPVEGGRSSLERLDPPDRVRLVDHYDARVLYVDAELRRFFDVVNGKEGTHAWVITSDHGEGVWSHGLLAHAEHLYEAQLRVPLLIYRSWDSKPGRVRHPVHIIDFYPTVLELAGLEPSAPREEAVSLLSGERSLERRTRQRLLLGQRSPFGYISRNPPSHAWTPDEVFAARKDRWKYIEHTAGAPELYDLVADPRELNNLDGSIQMPFGDELDEARRNVMSQSSADTPIPEEVERELRALGYAR